MFDEIATLKDSLNFLQGKLTIQDASYRKRLKVNADEIELLRQRNAAFKEKDEKQRKKIESLEDEIAFANGMEKYKRNERAVAINMPTSSTKTLFPSSTPNGTVGPNPRLNLQDQEFDPNTPSSALTPRSASKLSVAHSFVDGFATEETAMKRKLADTVHSPNTLPSKRFAAASAFSSISSDTESRPPEQETGNASQNANPPPSTPGPQNGNGTAHSEKDKGRAEIASKLHDAQKNINEFKTKNDQLSKDVTDLGTITTLLEKELTKAKRGKFLMSKKVEDLDKQLRQNVAKDSQKREVIVFFEKLFNHRAYGVFDTSWDLLTKWKLKRYKEIEYPVISNILKTHLFANGLASEKNGIEGCIEFFFDGCCQVITQLHLENNYRPIPVVLQLVYFTVNYYPKCAIFSGKLVKYLCAHLEKNVQYIRSLPEIDVLYAYKYNPFNLKSAGPYKGKTDKPGSTILQNDAFKEISILYTLDIIDKLASNAKYFDSYSYANIWSNISLSLISKLASPKSPANVIHKVMTLLFFSISEKTLGPIVFKNSKQEKPNSDRSETDERTKSNTPASSFLRNFSRGTSINPSDSATDTASSLALNPEKSTSLPFDTDIEVDGNSNLSEMVSSEQGYNESSLIVMLSYHLAYTVPIRHTLMFSGLEDLPVPYTCASNGENVEKQWSFFFNYLHYSDISSMPGDLESNYFSSLLNLHNRCGGPEKYYKQLSLINKITTLYIRKSIIKTFLHTVSVNSVSIIVCTKIALKAVIKCLRDTLDQVYQSLTPDHQSVELIGDCTNLLYTVFRFVRDNPYELGDNHVVSSLDYSQNKHIFGIATSKYGIKKWKKPSNIISDLSDDGLGLIAAMMLIVNTRASEQASGGSSALKPFDDGVSSPALSRSSSASSIASLVVIDSDDDKATGNGPPKAHNLGSNQKVDKDGDVSMNDDDEIQELGTYSHSEAVPKNLKEFQNCKLDNLIKDENAADKPETRKPHQSFDYCGPIFNSTIIEQADKILEYYYE